MAIADRFPLMKPGRTKRNALVVLGLFVLLPFIVVALPFYLLVAVGTNRNNLADRLADSSLGRLPGLANGGWTAGIAIFGYTVLSLMLLGGFLGGGESPETATDGSDLDEAGTPTAEGDAATAAETDHGDDGDGDDTATDDANTETGDGSDIDRVASDTYSESGLVTDVSESGDTVLFGFDDGNLMVYDAERDGELVPLGIDRSVSHIEIDEDANTATVGWMDAHAYGVIDLTENDGPAIQHPGLWDVDTAADGSTVASVSSPTEGTGSVGLSSDGDVRWETQFEDATALSVAITAGGDYIAVGAAHYWTDSDRRGTPGVKLYDADGTEQWTHETAEDVLSIDVDADREIVVAGTDDGKTIVLDFEGNVVRETDEYGGWVFLSGDGSTVVTSEADGTLLAVDAETGEERWTTDLGTWAADGVSVSDDGSRVLAADRAGGDVFVIEEGDVIWEASYEVGPAAGAISGDGSTWSVIVQNNDDGTARVELYRES